MYRKEAERKSGNCKVHLVAISLIKRW